MPFFSEGFRLNITYNLLIIQLTNLSMHVLEFRLSLILTYNQLFPHTAMRLVMTI